MKRMKRMPAILLALALAVTPAAGKGGKVRAAEGGNVIMQYDPATDTVGNIPLNAGKAAGDTYTDRFSAFSREGGAAGSNIEVADTEEGQKIRFYSLKTSANVNQVFMSKKADLSGGKTAVSTRIKGFNPTSAGTDYSGKKMFPQITLRAAGSTKKTPVFTMYNGVVTYDGKGVTGKPIPGLTYENEWHDVLIVFDTTGEITADYYYDGVKAVSGQPLTVDPGVDLSNLLLTFGAEFRSAPAECYYDTVRIYRMAEQTGVLNKTENVKLNETLSLKFSNQIDPESTASGRALVTDDAGETVEAHMEFSSSMDTANIVFAERLKPETVYTLSVSGLTDIFGQNTEMEQNFTTGKAAASLEGPVLKSDGVPVEGLQTGRLTAELAVDNQTTESFSGTVIAALFRNGAMTEVRASERQEIPAGEAKDISVDIDVEQLDDGDYSLKVFCVDDVLHLRALKEEREFAEPETAVEENTVSVTVKAENPEAEQNMILAVLKKGKTFAEIDPANPDTVAEGFAHLAQQRTDETGTCVFTFAFEQEKGRYLYRAADGTGNHYEGDFLKFTPEDTMQALEQLKGFSEEEFCDFLKEEDNRKILGLPEELYSSLNAAQQTQALHMMYREYTAVKPSSSEQVQECFQGNVLTVIISSAANADEVKKLAERYSGILKFESGKLYGVFRDVLSESLRRAVYAALSGKEYEDARQLRETFDSLILTESLLKVSNWKEVLPILEGAEKALQLGMDLSGRQQLNYPSEVDRKMANQEFADCHAVKEAFNRAVKAQAESERKNNGGGGTGGSFGGGGFGGGSGGGGHTVTTPVTPQQEIEPVPQHGNENGQTDFEDLEGVPWAQESIWYLKAKGILNGREEGRFYPDENITREEFLKVLLEALELADKNAVCDFTDVEKEAWYYPYVAAAFETGIVNGVEKDVFGVGRFITREDLAAMTFRALGYAEIDLGISQDKTEFSDGENIAAYAKEAVDALQQAGVLTGGVQGEFAPRAAATRAETACVIFRMMQRIEQLYTVKN